MRKTLSITRTESMCIAPDLDSSVSEIRRHVVAGIH